MHRGIEATISVAGAMILISDKKSKNPVFYSSTWHSSTRYVLLYLIMI